MFVGVKLVCVCVFVVVCLCLCIFQVQGKAGCEDGEGFEAEQ